MSFYVGLVNVLHESGESKKFLISSGSVTVNFDNTVQLLVEEAYTLDEFDKSQASFDTTLLSKLISILFMHTDLTPSNQEF